MTRKKKITTEEFDALLPCIFEVAEKPVTEIDLDPADLNIDVQTLPPASSTASPASSDSAEPAPPAAGTRPILIRVPERVIRAFKTEASRTGGHYQSLMNQALKEAVDRFV